MELEPLPPNERRRERRKDARPSEILDAALDVFAEKGFAAAKLDDIAARAGISKGTLYLYFTSKEELLKGVVHENIVNMIEEGRVFIREYPGDTPSLLRDFVIEWWRRKGMTKVSAIPKLIMSEAGNFPEIAKFYYEEVICPADEMITSILRRGVERGEFAPVARLHETALSIMCAVLFVVNWKHSIGPCVPRESVDAEQFLNNHVSLLVDGLRPRTSPRAA
ncbi:MAG: TetR/AcrR family transcriptional regulator [Betaproteobacteria bacterium]|nr:TetR/AcrR family transcriptional regulator [Betaproteobacteria bacterium]